LIKGLKSV